MSNLPKPPKEIVVPVNFKKKPSPHQPNLYLYNEELLSTMNANKDFLVKKIGAAVELYISNTLHGRIIFIEKEDAIRVSNKLEIFYKERGISDSCRTQVIDVELF